MIYPMVPFSAPWMTLYLDFKVTGLSQMPLTCAQLTRDLFAIAKFLFYCSFYKCRPVAIIFYADYTEFICNTIADLRASPTYCCYTTLGTSSTRQCASATCVTNDRALYSVKHRSSFLREGLVASEIALILIQFTIRYDVWCRIEYMRLQFKTWPTWYSFIDACN